MRILALNLWHGRQQAELRDFLLAHTDATDLFCFQEANGSAVEPILAELFSEDHYNIISTEKIAEPIGHYKLITVIRKEFEIINSYDLLSDSDREVGKALAVEIACGSRRLKVINIHGVPQPGHKLDTEGRLRQSREVLDATDGTPSVICGDFNLLPEAKSVNMLTSAGYENLIQEYSIPTTRNRLAWEDHPNNKQFFADYVFTSPEVEVVNFAVPNTEVSDHLPMILDIA